MTLAGQKGWRAGLALLLVGLLVLGAALAATPRTRAAAAVKAQYRAGDINAGDNAIKPFLQLVNTGTASVSLATLKARYYFTWEGSAQTLQYACDWAVLGCGNVTASFASISAAASGADRYLELGFTSGAGSLAAGQSSGEIQSRFNKSDWSNFNETGDYSFDPSKTAFADWSRVTVHESGVLIWGAAPGGSVVPTNTSAPAATTTRTFTAVPGATATRTSPPAATATRTSTSAVVPTTPPTGGRQMERLGRGLVKVVASGGNFVSWRLLGNDPAGVSFNLYRNGTKLNATPITGATNYFDSGAASSSTYTVRPLVSGVEQAEAPSLLNISGGYHTLPLQVPAGGTSPDGVAYTYSPNDASAGDLDGDGEYEIVVKWDPSNAKDNSQSGYTGNVYLDAYKLSGTRLWRIDLGRNIRAGAHYTQFMVYDLDGDGRAEVAAKTADGTVDGAGRVIGSSSADYRNSSGYVLSGPEFLTVFNGQTGAALATTSYVPARGTVSSWGDSYGNRVDRFLAGIAYLDGQRPSLIMARGYYTRSVIVAWDWRSGALTQRWVFDSNVAGSSYTGQGNHQLSIADADADGRDEIMYGSMAINDNGQALWNNNTFHGDAYHVGDLDPSRPGLEVFKPSEHTDQLAHWFADARTGQIIWSAPSCGCDNGRGVSGDIWSGSAGAESWSSAVSGLISAKGQNVGRKPSSTNFLAWWDGDTVRELLDGNHIDKYGTSADTRLLTADGAASNNGTKSTPALSADLFGDWREEVIWRASDNRSLRIYTTSAVTSQRLFTLMHDAQYRVAIAWQNVAYNQPPHPSFFLGSGMATPAQPNIYVR